ncbi:MAG TPA: FAD-dependent oxidoreductase [Actinomycetota bacterium]|nr:FAD-dependent oxidoreductase [Actinomycetota bacterium]
MTGPRVVVVGGGIVGCSLAYHLVGKGWDDVTVLEQGPLPAAGGSTSHAPGLVFQTNPSKTMTELARRSVELYSSLSLRGMPCFYPVGGIEVAGTPERWTDLARKLGLARSWGIPAELLSPEEVVARIPLVDPARIHGGFHVPGDGIAKAVHACEAMAEAASARGASFRARTSVTGFEVAGGAVRGVRTDGGVLEADVVVICAGIWGPRAGALAGVSIPLLPMQHQYAWTSPLPSLEGIAEEVVHPILRHQDAAMYFRHNADRYGVGSYAHRSMPVSPDDLPAYDDAEVAPAIMGFTEEDFKPAWEEAIELLPALADATLQEPINGIFSFTADGLPLLGPAPEPAGLWIAEAVWITHAGGVGRAMADWIVDGAPDVDLRECDLNRFEAHGHNPDYVAARASQSFQEVYDIIHPLQPMEEPRPLRASPFYDRERALGAFFLEASGWERPHWFESNRGLLDDVAVPERSGWEARYWSPIVGAEHLHTRTVVALYDMTPLKRLEVSGPGAAELMQRLTTSNVDRAVGTVTYTLMLDDRGGIRSDITVARLDDQRFQVGCNGPLDHDWIARHGPADGSVHVRDITGGTCCIGLWGPRARDLLERVTPEDVSNRAFPYFRARAIHVGEVPVVALRLSYVGELGWELYASAEYGGRLWDLLWRAGEPLGVIAAGRGAFEGLRLEKGYRSWGKDMTTEDNPYEAGLGWAVKPDKGDFVGRDALARLGGPDDVTRRLACLTLDDAGAVVMGKEPVHADGEVAGWVTSAAYGHSVGRCVAYAYLPAPLARPGTGVEIEYFGRNLRATVAREPLWDPDMTRLRA